MSPSICLAVLAIWPVSNTFEQSTKHFKHIKKKYQTKASLSVIHITFPPGKFQIRNVDTRTFTLTRYICRSSAEPLHTLHTAQCTLSHSGWPDRRNLPCLSSLSRPMKRPFQPSYLFMQHATLVRAVAIFQSTWRGAPLYDFSNNSYLALLSSFLFYCMSMFTVVQSNKISNANTACVGFRCGLKVWVTGRDGGGADVEVTERHCVPSINFCTP